MIAPLCVGTSLAIIVPTTIRSKYLAYRQARLAIVLNIEMMGFSPGGSWDAAISSVRGRAGQLPGL
jgi:hypothetical protein